MTEGFVILRRTDKGEWEFEYGGEVGVEDGFISAGRWYSSSIGDDFAFSVVVRTRDGRAWRIGVEEDRQGLRLPPANSRDKA